MVYNTSKIFVNNFGRKFNKLKWYSIKLCCFVCTERLNYIIYIFLKSWRQVKTQGIWQKVFFYGCNSGMIFVRFNDFFMVALS